jgi:thiol-disulfide isomerase/thioredoxin|tara:strand:- start:680 stop:1270 length:591 start_codon:yes stop_codon:yes gene_type:complete
MKVTIKILIYLLSLSIISCSNESNNQDPEATVTQEKVSERNFLGEFELIDLNNVMTHSSKWNGQYKLINFWATWCAPCRREIPLLNNTQKEYQDMSVQIIGIAVDVLDDVIAYSEETPFEYPVLVGEEEAIAIAENANIEFIGLPFTMLVDDQNEIIKTHLGEIKEHHIDMLTEVIRGMQRGKISVEEAKIKLGKI